VHGLHCYGNITRTRNVSEYTMPKVNHAAIQSVVATRRDKMSMFKSQRDKA